MTRAETRGETPRAPRATSAPVPGAPLVAAQDRLAGSEPVAPPVVRGTVAGGTVVRARRSAGRHRARALLARWVPPLLLLAASIGAWELWVIVRRPPAYVLPSPGRIAAAAVDAAPGLPAHTATTLVEAVVGTAAGALAGVAVAVLIASVPLARRTVEPLLVASQTVPMIVLAPLLVLWFGLGLTPKIVVVALIGFFPVAVSTAGGLAGADPDLVDLVRSMGARPGQVLRVVRLPAAIPAFFAGLKIATAYAVAGAVVGEYVAGDRGLGIFITRSSNSFRVDRVFVAVIVIAALSALLYGLVGVAARRATPWLPPTTKERSR
ncbi:MAG: ABC transporter permease [Actinobacteria bacterium]|nr:ABC transporter permease [Actinomycetota bacterium]